MMIRVGQGTDSPQKKNNSKLRRQYNKHHKTLLMRFTSFLSDGEEEEEEDHIDIDKMVMMRRRRKFLFCGWFVSCFVHYFRFFFTWLLFSCCSLPLLFFLLPSIMFSLELVQSSFLRDLLPLCLPRKQP